MFMPNLGSFFTHPDPDPWPKNIPDPPGSGSETLFRTQCFFSSTSSREVAYNMKMNNPVGPKTCQGSSLTIVLQS